MKNILLYLRYLDIIIKNSDEKYCIIKICDYLCNPITGISS